MPEINPDLFADRVGATPRSFIREILSVTVRPEVISFAGGLPNPDLFPVKAFADAARDTLLHHGAEALQYATTEGYEPLREFVAERYTNAGLHTTPDQVLITSGSQQGLDLVGKLFLNKGETVMIESPGYLGAIQAFALCEPLFIPAPLGEDGVLIEPLVRRLAKNKPKLFYAVPNFQNPTGLSYSIAKRKQVAKAIDDSGAILIEDDPYGELRFIGRPLFPVNKYLESGRGVLLGSFSKVVAPGLRLGWMRADQSVISQAVVMKQATDLHTNYLAQRALMTYLANNSLDDHIALIRARYGDRRNLMVEEIEKNFPKEVTITRPEGGMFLWASLPPQLSALKLFEKAIAHNVAFVPGAPFHIDGGGDHAFRLNFSNASEENIVEGIARIAATIEEAMAAV